LDLELKLDKYDKAKVAKHQKCRACSDLRPRPSSATDYQQNKTEAGKKADHGIFRV
jgi:hypothetical protein